jgi:hypothetical protein
VTPLAPSRVGYSPQQPVGNPIVFPKVLSEQGEQILLAKLSPDQWTELSLFSDKELGTGQFKVAQVLDFFIELIANDVDYQVSFQAAQDCLEWMRNGKSYDQSVILVSEKIKFQIPDVERIYLFRFMSDMMIRLVNPKDATARVEPKDTAAYVKPEELETATARLDQLMRFFFQEINIEPEQRWQFVQKLLNLTEGMKFDDRMEVISSAIGILKDISIEDSFRAVSYMCELMKGGQSFDQAAECLDKLQTAQLAEANNAPRPTAA